MTNKFKKKALRVIANHLCVEETKGIKDMSKMMEIDNNDTISYEKLKAGLRKLNSHTDESEV